MKKEITRNEVTVTIDESKIRVTMSDKLVATDFKPHKDSNGLITIGRVRFENKEFGEEIYEAYQEVIEYKISQDPEVRNSAQRTIEEVAARGEENLLTEADEKKWRRTYNNINNEGGYGFVPSRATVESYSQAKRILGL